MCADINNIRISMITIFIVITNINNRIFIVTRTNIENRIIIGNITN